MAGRGVRQPVRRDTSIHVCLASRTLEQTKHSTPAEMTAGSAWKHRGIGSRVTTKRQKGLGDDRRQEYLPCEPALAGNGELHEIAAWEYVAPSQRHNLGNPEASGIEGFQQNLITLRPSGPDQGPDLDLAQDALG